MRRIFSCLILLLFFLTIPLSVHTVLAQEPTKQSGQQQSNENFATDYQVTYSVREDGTTHAVIKVTLTNLTSDYYASSYKVQLGFENLVNIQASDSGGKIVPDISKTDDGQLIGLKFNKNVVGFNNKQVVTIAFDTPDVAKKQGLIWEINIPGIANQSAFSSFTVKVEVPKAWGTPAYVKPALKDKTLTFTKEQLGKSGISIAFGEKQAYHFSLQYHLQNKNLFPIRTEIALPPTTNYQEVSIDHLVPKPEQVHQDTDGNWLAEYNLSPAQRIDVTAKGKVVVSLKPTALPVDEQELQKYLEEKPYWHLSNAKIKDLAKDLKTPEAIYAYVIKTLHYDFSRVTSGKSRLGAVGVLQRPKSAVCLEFTDLFVALARAAGIPAREVDGYAYTQNPRQRPLSLIQDILHAWPEYYDMSQQTWVMVDPTWGNTTGGVDYFTVFDFDHVTLVKKGVSSTYPIPAGGYKTDDDEQRKDLNITFADSVVLTPALLTTELSVGTTYTAGFPIGGSVTIHNNGPTVSNDAAVIFTSETLTPHEKKLTVDRLLPFEQKKIGFSFDKQPILTKSTHTITMNLVTPQSGASQDGKPEKRIIQVVPVFLQEWRFVGGIGIAILTVIILIIAIKAGRIHLSG